MGEQHLQDAVIEEYVQYGALEALAMAAQFSPSPQFQLGLLNRCFPKFSNHISKEALAKGIEVMKWALAVDASLNPKEFLIYLATLDFQQALHLALSLQNIDNRSKCSLALVTKHLPKCNNPGFYNHSQIIASLTLATDPRQTAINKQVFNFIFKQSADAYADFEALVSDYLMESVPYYMYTEHLYDALVAAGMPPQGLLHIIQRLVSNKLDSSKIKEWQDFLIRKGNKLMSLSQ